MIEKLGLKVDGLDALLEQRKAEKAAAADSREKLVKLAGELKRLSSAIAAKTSLLEQAKTEKDGVLKTILTAVSREPLDTVRHKVAELQTEIGYLQEELEAYVAMKPQLEAESGRAFRSIRELDSKILRLLHDAIRDEIRARCGDLIPAIAAIRHSEGLGDTESPSWGGYVLPELHRAPRGIIDAEWKETVDRLKVEYIGAEA